MMDKGQPTGGWRYPGDKWSRARGTVFVRFSMIKFELNTNTGPEIRTHLLVETRHEATR